MLAIVCVVMIIGSYFLYNYQGKQREKARMEKEEIAEKERLDSIAVIDSYKPMDSLLEKELSDFISATKKEASDKRASKLYYITIGKDKDGSYLEMFSGYGFDKEKIKGFTRHNGEVIIFFGDLTSANQNLVNEELLIKAFEQIEFYADEKPEKEYKPLKRRYNIIDKDSLLFIN